MRTYTTLSNAVNRAITTGDHELRDKLKKEIEPLIEVSQYGVLLNILNNAPDSEPLQDEDSTPIPDPKSRQRTDYRPAPFMTLTEAKTIVRVHKEYIAKHREIVLSKLGVTRRHRRINKLRCVYMSNLNRLNPPNVDAGKKLEMAKDLLGMQTENTIDRGGSLVMSPRFRGGRMLSGGLPGSKR